MRKLIIAMAAGAALTAASAANATITLGSTGMTAGSSTGGVSSTITNNTTVPNTISFITTNAAAGTDTSFIDFIEDYASVGTFSVTTATNPSSTVTLINVLTGEMVPLDSGTYGASAGSNSGSSYSLNLTTNLAANTWYRFFYTADMAKPGDITGTASFDVAPVPEPATWAMMLLGFAGIGVSLRRRRPGLAQVA